MIWIANETRTGRRTVFWSSELFVLERRTLQERKMKDPFSESPCLWRIGNIVYWGWSASLKIKLWRTDGKERDCFRKKERERERVKKKLKWKKNLALVRQKERIKKRIRAWAKVHWMNVRRTRKVKLPKRERESYKESQKPCEPLQTSWMPTSRSNLEPKLEVWPE